MCGLAVVLEVDGLHGRDKLRDLPLYVVAKDDPRSLVELGVEPKETCSNKSVN